MRPAGVTLKALQRLLPSGGWNTKYQMKASEPVAGEVVHAPLVVSMTHGIPRVFHPMAVPVWGVIVDEPKTVELFRIVGAPEPVGDPMYTTCLPIGIWNGVMVPFGD